MTLNLEDARCPPHPEPVRAHRTPEETRAALQAPGGARVHA